LLRRWGSDNRGGYLVGRGGKASPCPRSCGLGRTGRHGNGSSFGRGGRGSRNRLLGLLDVGRRFNSRSLVLLWRLLTDSCGNLLSLRGLNLLGYLFGWGSRGSFLNSRLLLRNLLELLIHLVQVLLAGGLGALVDGGGFGDSGSVRRLMDAVGRLVLDVLLLFGLVCKIAEDIVQDEVAIGLLGENEGLRETLVGLALVGDFADDLDNDVRVGALGIDVGDADFGVLVVEILDALVDGLSWSASLHSLVHSVIPSVLRIRRPSPLRRPRRTASACCRKAVPKVSRVLHNNTNWCRVTYVESVRALA
jgi:hypothetical protein